MANVKIPPNGFIGTGSQTAAVQHMANKAMGPARKKVTRRKKAAAKKRPVRRKRTTARKKTAAGRKKRPAHMVKGSAAARRHMAKLRRMRRKK